jgi:phage host-nuclease inhibitor protein Gam
VQQTRAQTAAADAAELSVKIERVIRQIGELQKQWERRSKVYGAAVAFLATKGINI